MELDGYCEKLGLAFEYQGNQHTEFTEFFHSDESDLRRRIADDHQKKDLCRANEVDLFVVDIGIPIEDLAEHLLNCLTERRPDLGDILNKQPFDFSTVRAGKQKVLEEISKVARERGGECLSSIYIASNLKLRFRCKKGHEWDAVPYTIKAGSWCPECQGERISAALLKRRDLEPLKKIVSEKGGMFLGPGRKNPLDYRVRCKAGHEWETRASRLRNGHWCQKCSAKENAKRFRLSIEDLKRIARERGGECLSRRYSNSTSKYLWQCGKDPEHKWLATGNSVRRGSWCPACAGKPKFLFRGDVEEFLRREEGIEQQ